MLNTRSAASRLTLGRMPHAIMYMALAISACVRFQNRLRSANASLTITSLARVVLVCMVGPSMSSLLSSALSTTLKRDRMGALKADVGSFIAAKKTMEHSAEMFSDLRTPSTIVMVCSSSIALVINCLIMFSWSSLTAVLALLPPVAPNADAGASSRITIL
jgi:hypothetical protein